MLERLKFETYESWVAGRRIGIGGSEAAAAIGMSPWQSPVELWKLKCGITASKDLSGNPAVERGKRMEPILRDFYMATHTQYALEYHPYDMLYQKERPWLFATLDGELIEAESVQAPPETVIKTFYANGEETETPYTGEIIKSRRGILEIKTASPNGKDGWSKWANGNMPPQYYTQCLHQLLATGYDFVRLFAALYSQNGDITLREYEIDRDEDVQADIDWLVKKETEFWGYVQRGEMPPMPLTL